MSVNVPNQHRQDSEEDSDKGKVKDTNDDTLIENPLPQPQATELVEIPFVSMSDFEIVDMNDKLNLLMSAINKMNNNFHHKFDSLKDQLSGPRGVITRLDKMESAYQELLARVDNAESSMACASDNTRRISALESQVEKLTNDVAALKGFVQVQDSNLQECKKKVVDLTARSMMNNITISGLMGDKKGSEGEPENCKATVLKFMRNELQMEVEDNEIEVAHRVGKPLENKPRLMVVRCVFALKNRIFGYTKNLKGIQNANGDFYSVKQQLPEPLLSERIQREERMREIIKSNDQLPEEQQHRKVLVQIKNRVLYINKVPQKQNFIQVPTVQEVFNATLEEQVRMEELEFTSSNQVTDKGSIFRAHTLKTHNSKDIRLAYKKIKLLYPESHHIMLAYRVKTYVGFNDDEEYG